MAPQHRSNYSLSSKLQSYHWVCDEQCRTGAGDTNLSDVKRELAKEKTLHSHKMRIREGKDKVLNFGRHMFVREAYRGLVSDHLQLRKSVH